VKHGVQVVDFTRTVPVPMTAAAVAETDREALRQEA